MKDAYYFPHDCNARHDPKIVSLCMKWKSLGYAAYFITIEMLREQNDYKLQAMLKPCLQMAWGMYETIDYGIFHDLLTDMIKLDLFQEEDGFIFSSSLIQRMQVYDNRRDALREAGRKGGLSSAKAKLKPSSSKAQAVKESKVKESKDIVLPSKTKQFIDWWYQQYLARFNKRYFVQGGKDGSLVKKIVGDLGLEEAKRLAVLFFESEDKFIVNSGHTLGVFHSQINKLSGLFQEQDEYESAMKFDTKDN